MLEIFWSSTRVGTLVTVDGALRATLTAGVLGALAALAGCAHAPPTREPPPRVTLSVSPPPETGSSSAAAEAQSPDSAGASSAAAASSELAEAPQESLEPVTGIDPAAYADLFDRLRAGFALEEVDRPAVTEQITWFAENPDFVQHS